ncbi:MAG TPA: hypothetical protein V6D10_02810 [Trichocoleus sp.]
MSSKHKSKKKKKKNVKQQAVNQLENFGIGVKDISATVISAFIGQVITSAIERLTRENSHDSVNNKAGMVRQASDKLIHHPISDSDDEVDSDEIDSNRPNHQNPVSTAKHAAQDKLNDVKPLMQDALEAIKAAIQETTPGLSDALSSAKNKTGDSKQTVNTLVQGAIDAARQVLSSNTDSFVPAAIGNLMTNTLGTMQTDLPDSAQKDSSQKKEKSGKKKGKKKKKA